ncbi:MLC2 [Candida oxycetoniae]|uniref:MLC2 n=1 Tax=Candida oxycetoniae TaxID=497107 RepID=A0AAI9SVK8_9ASCO|nr:MLC2 [Candida oxycetoniae]KAI3403315.2 MLC2 [Candida oxycetoniae]
MSHLSSLSFAQKTQIKNVFTLIDGESRDSKITLDDLEKIYSSIGLVSPDSTELRSMLTIDGKDYSESGISFAQFSNIMAKEISNQEEKSKVFNALQVFLVSDNYQSYKGELQVDVNKLRDACCSISVEINGKNKILARQDFDKSVKGFVSETMDGKQVLLASKWLDAYLDG